MSGLHGNPGSSRDELSSNAYADLSISHSDSELFAEALLGDSTAFLEAERFTNADALEDYVPYQQLTDRGLAGGVQTRPRSSSIPTRSSTFLPWNARRNRDSRGLGRPSTPSQTAAMATTCIDLRALDYVEPVQANLMCPICHSYFVRPIKLECDHAFCYDCIIGAMDHQPEGAQSCPSCRRKTKHSRITTLPRFVDALLDEVEVVCPNRKHGCTERVTRGSIQDHVLLYCAHLEMPCPLESCTFTISRKDLSQPCQHTLVICPDCGLEMQERLYEQHQTKECEQSTASCPGCEESMLQRQLEEHMKSCPEAILPCPALPYGCEFTGKRSQLDSHSESCALRKLTPFLDMQRAKLDEHEAGIKSLQRQNDIYKTSLAQMQEMLDLGPSSSSNSSRSLVDAPPFASTQAAPFDSTASHLLSLHEALREEISRASNEIAQLDAKTDMTFLNQGLRQKEEMAHMTAMVNRVGLQLQWLMSSKLQMQQRASMLRAQPPSEAGPSVLAGSQASSSAASSSSASVLAAQQPRRLSDSTRQETKL